MPIKQERLISLLEITRRAIGVTLHHRNAAKKVIMEFNDKISDEIRRSQNPEETVRLVYEFLNNRMAILIDYQMDVEDLITFKTEETHFKFNKTKNEIQKAYYRRARGRRKMSAAASLEESFLSEDYDLVDKGFDEVRGNNQDKTIELDEETIMNLDIPQTKTETTNPEIDPIRAQYERDRDARLQNQKPITRIIDKDEANGTGDNGTGNTPQDRNIEDTAQ